MKNKMVLVSFFLTTIQLYAQPQIRIDGSNTLNWGKVFPGKLEKNLVIYNIGDDTLFIKKVQPSCGCTAAPLDKNLIAPGQSATIHVALNAETAQGGTMSRSLTIKSNDPLDSVVDVNLLAYIMKELEVKHAYFPMEKAVKPGEEYSSSVTIENTSAEDQEIRFPKLEEVNSVEVKFEMPEKVVIKPGEKYTLRARITPLKEGLTGAIVKVPNSSKSIPELKLTLQCMAMVAKK